MSHSLRGLLVVSAFALCLGCACAQVPASGLYEIISGHYSECCGLAGREFGYDLPQDNQGFVRLTVDAQKNVATLTLLAQDRQTVFHTIECPPFSGNNFSFDRGQVFSNHIVFQAGRDSPPYEAYWNYTVSNSGNGLRIDGVLETVETRCADVPTRFNHSNVVAVLVPGPRLTTLEWSSDRGARIMVQGEAGSTNVIEASTDLVVWTPVSTNSMETSDCPTCPMVIFEDPAATNLQRRFYRAFESR